MSKKIAYFLFLGVVGFFRIIPFFILYRLSDLLYLIFAYIIRYRASVIDKNLKKCFPERSSKELSKIKRKFYRNLCDIILESIKGYSMSKEQIMRRYKIYDAEIMDEYCKQGKDVIVLAGHIGNFEWAATPIAHFYLHKPITFYKPLSNQYINKYIKDKRERYGGEMASIFRTGAYFVRKNERPVAFYLVADQYPPDTNRQVKVNFFNSVTPFLDGPEKYFKKHNLPVVFIEILQTKRGYYSLRTINVVSGIEYLNGRELTQIYANLLEENIKTKPDDWMWSHKRWKKELYSFD